MTTKVTVGLARDFFDAEGNFNLPGPGLELFAEMPGIQYRILAEQRAEVAPEQVRGCDAVISGASRWSERSLIGNDQLVAVLLTGVGYDHIDVEALTRANAMLCSAPDAVRRPMACTIITFMLALATRLINKDRITREGRWADQRLYRGRRADWQDARFHWRGQYRARAVSAGQALWHAAFGLRSQAERGGCGRCGRGIGQYGYPAGRVRLR